MAAPRGVRNNNPGNIDRSGVAWQGEDRSAKARQQEARFCVFTSAEFGFRALAKVLQTYQSKHGLRTVKAIINRWAPPTENITSAYVREVAKALSVDPDSRIDVTKFDTAFGIAKAISRHENGGHYWSDATIAKGLELAGVRA
ncbi:MAG: structural protein P5 [Luteimonas sp.]